MDISVSQLNNRMAIQVPPQFPLGLVFVVGQITNLQRDTDPIIFELMEKEYSLHCRLSPRAGTNIQISENDRARAGGHLLFDPTTASYFLIARDIEILSAIPPVKPRGEFKSILADVQKRAEATRLAVAELPNWVKQLAPPEVREELEDDSPLDEEPEAPPQPALHELNGAVPVVPTVDADTLSFLTQAMESTEEIEITPEMVAKLIPRPTSAPFVATDHPLAASSPLPTQPPAPVTVSYPQPATSQPIVARNSERALIFIIITLCIALLIVLGLLTSQFL